MSANKAFRRLCRNRITIVAILFLIVLALTAIFAAQLCPYAPYESDFNHVAEPPNSQHWMGTDELGRDILSRIMFGARISLLVGLVVQITAVSIGTLIGLVSGYYGGILDLILMRIVDVLYSFPSFLLIIFIVSILNPGVLSIIFTLSFVNWPFYARLVRSNVISLKEKEFVLAAHTLGFKDMRVMLFHILPNTLSPILVQVTFGIGFVIMAESSLSFLGIGIRSPVASWGGMISRGREYFLGAPHMVLFPSILLGLTILAFNFLGDALRDLLDPNMSNQL